MSKEVIQNIKKIRLARKAQTDSGLKQEIKALQKRIVIESFSKSFDSNKHQSLMNKLKELKSEYNNLGLLQLN